MNLLKTIQILAVLTIAVQSQGLWDSFDESSDSVITPANIDDAVIKAIESKNVEAVNLEPAKIDTPIAIESVESKDSIIVETREKPISEVEIPRRFPQEKFQPQEELVPPAAKPQAKPFVLSEEKVKVVPKSEKKEEINNSVFKVPFDKKPIVQNRTSVTLVPLYEKQQGEYVSPKVAGFSSLILPGLGQFRVPDNKLRGSLYVISEVAIGISLWYFGFEKQQESIDSYKSIEKKYFSKSDYEEWSSGLKVEAINQAKANEYDKNYDATRGTWCRSIYGDDQQGVTDCANRSSSHLQYVKNEDSKVANSEAYYKLIASNQWVSGWDDGKLKSHKEVIASGIYNNIGTSQHQSDFKSARKDAEFYASVKTWLITALIANHIISAIDAAYSAEKNNEQLYKENPLKTSFNINAKGEYQVALNWSLSW